MQTAGRRFAEALAAKDTAALRAVLADDVDFRGLTPRKTWEADDVDGALEIVLGSWFDPEDHIDALLEAADGDDVEDLRRVSYRLAVTNADGRHIVEQQAYYVVTGKRISRMRVLCSGYRPVAC